MRSMLRIVAFALLGLAVSLPAFSAKKAIAQKAGAKKDQDKDKDGDKDKEKEKPKEKWIKFGMVTGKVTATDEAKKSLTIQLTIGKNKKDVKWTAIDDVKVRMLNPPPHFDDKGRIKPYTRKELSELKGDDKRTPGFPAEFSDIKRDQYVQVTLVKKKGVRPPRRKPKDADPAAMEDYLPKMSMIVIANEQK